MLRWAVVISLLGTSVVISVCQWVAVGQAIHRQRKDPNAAGYSLIPLLGGCIGICGFLLAPAAEFRVYWWLPLLLDPGCALLGTATFCFVLRARFINASDS